MIIAATAGLTIFQLIVEPPLYVSLPIAAVISLVLLRLNASKLQVGEMFPELLKIPGVKVLLG
jgi:hypothetical protein